MGKDYYIEDILSQGVSDVPIGFKLLVTSDMSWMRGLTGNEIKVLLWMGGTAYPATTKILNREQEEKFVTVSGVSLRGMHSSLSTLVRKGLLKRPSPRIYYIHPNVLFTGSVKNHSDKVRKFEEMENYR